MNRAQRMVRRNAAFDGHITEQRRLRLGGATHRYAPEGVYHTCWKTRARRAQSGYFFSNLLNGDDPQSSIKFLVFLVEPLLNVKLGLE